MIPDINLLPHVDRRQSNSKLIWILMGVISLLLLSIFLWKLLDYKSDIKNLRAEETNLITERDKIKTEVTAQQDEKKKGTIVDSLQFVELVSYPVKPLIDEIEVLKTDNAYLRNYEFTTDEVKIIVDFETLSDVSTYVSRLSNSDYFSDSQVLSIEKFEIAGGEDALKMEKAQTEEKKKTNFNIVPRQSVEISLQIDENYLALGGDQ